MAMSVGEGGADTPMSEINTTPLVDVMLVLLIIFLITIPVVKDKVALTLPKTAYQATITKAENVLLSVKTDENGLCAVYWGIKRVSAGDLAAKARVKYDNETARLGADATDPDLFPEVHIRADRGTPYRCIGGTMSVMQSERFIRVGFISEPPPRS